MVLQAYIDDSLDDDGTFVLAGYISTEESWAKFSEEWERMLSRGVLDQSGNYHFKMSEMAMSPERMGRVNGFHNIISRHVIMSIYVVLNIHDLSPAMRRVYVSDAGGKRIGIYWGDWESAFFVASRAIIDAFHQFRFSTPDKIPLDGVVDFYFDQTTEREAVIRSWNDQMAILPREHRALFGSVPRFEDDRKFLPLQAADFRAWWVRKWAIEHGYENVAKGKYPFKVVSNEKLGIGIIATEDSLASNFVNILRSQYPRAIVYDTGPPNDNVQPEILRVDPPFPTEIAWAVIKRLFSRYFR